MKVNEVPEKVYISDSELNNSEHCIIWFKSQQNEKDIEYIRADAFIEKACGWLKESVTNNPECNRIISKKGVITMGELIEDFRKYMGK